MRECLNRPANLAVASLLTVETFQPGRIVKYPAELADRGRRPALLTSRRKISRPNTNEVYVCIRAEDVILHKGSNNPSSARNHLSAVVKSASREGPLLRVELDCGFALSALLTVPACEEMGLIPGDPVIALVKAQHPFDPALNQAFVSNK